MLSSNGHHLFNTSKIDVKLYRWPLRIMYWILLCLWTWRCFAQTLRVLNWYAPQLPHQTEHLGKSEVQTLFAVKTIYCFRLRKCHLNKSDPSVPPREESSSGSPRDARLLPRPGTIPNPRLHPPCPAPCPGARTHTAGTADPEGASAQGTVDF